MVLCSQCKKRPAVVFITTMKGSEKKNEGLCLLCAKKLNIPQVSEFMEHMGITDDDLEQMSDQLTNMMDSPSSFEMGGASTFPEFFKQLYTDSDSSGEEGDDSAEDADGEKPRSRRAEAAKKAEKEKKEKHGKLRYLDSYCTNLSRKAEEGQQ